MDDGDSTADSTPPLYMEWNRAKRNPYLRV